MRFMFRAPLLALVSFLLPLAAQAQTQAACTFKFFSTKTNITASNGNPVFLQPLGIDDFSTIVGFGDRISAGEIGLVRWANGGIVHVSGTKALVARNDNGTMVADVRVNSTWQGVLVNGPTSSPTFTPLVLNIPLDPNAQVFPAGINKWGTVIGHYWNPDPSENAHGFKRWSNGTTHILDFPGAAPNTTIPKGINDLGTVVGTYQHTHGGRQHGFILHNGQWATLDYPNAGGTVLVGITNTGQIIGNGGPSSVFLYENGTFKVISVPNSVPWLPPSLLSISPKQGLILGRMDSSASSQGFVAKCQ